MKKAISRRNLLKAGLLGGASIPFISAKGMSDNWFMNEFGTPDLKGEDTLVKLNSNENPYGPSASARQAVVDTLDAGNRYPRNIISKLRKAIAEKEGLSADHVMITAGSTELLGLAGMYFGLKGGNLISSQPTFDFLLYYAEKQMGANWIRVPLTEDHQYNLDGIRKATNADTKLIFVCNPNNPTGVEIPNNDVKEFVEEMAPKYPVYLDEAYIELSSMGLKGSMAPMVDRYPNLMIARTFSKIYGLAGLRIGYLIAHPDTVKSLSYAHTGRSITPSVTSVAAAKASLGDDEFFAKSRSLNAKAREKVHAAFDTWGIESLPSDTSFILFRTDKFDLDIYKELQRNNVLIRTYSHVPGWARVSMGTLDEMDIFLKYTQKFMS